MHTIPTQLLSRSLAWAALPQHPSLLAATKNEGPSGGVVIAALCVLAAVIFAGVLWQGHRRRTKWFRAPAVVTDLVERSISSGNTDVFPKFTFVDARGVEVSLEQRSNRPRCQLGEQIDVLQNPNDPTHVVADRTSRR